MNNPYADNPFDDVFAAPAPTASAVPVPGSHVKPTAQQPNNLDDLLNPFAVLGLENKKPAASPMAQQQPTGAGWASPRSATANPYAMAAAAAAPSFGAAIPQQHAPQQQQAAWGVPSPHSAFQPPAAINTSPIASPIHFPDHGAAVSPANSYGAPSPAYGLTYSPASPAFMSAPPAQSLYTASSPMAAGMSSPLNRSGAGTPAVVTDADLALFAAPVVAVKAPPKQQPASPAPVAHAVASPTPAQQAPAPAQQQQAAGGWAATATPQPNDGWDNDDFGISWEQPKAKPAAESPKRESEAPVAPVESPSKKSTAGSSSSAAAEGKNDPIAGEHPTEGTVLARISVRTLIVKEWKETFWIVSGGKLLLYRSKEDYLYNPVGVMVKKDIPLRDNLRCSEVTCKPYKGYGDLYHFTLEEMLDYGPSLIAKFASTDAKAIRELRAVIIAYIIHERKRRSGVRARPAPTPAVPGGDSVMHHSSPKPASASSASGAAPEGDKYAKWGTLN